MPTDERFYDKYDYSTNGLKFSNGKLGDATKEIGPFYIMYYGKDKNVMMYDNSWYNEQSTFIFNGYPWIRRGGDYRLGVNSGIFNFHYNYVLSPETVSFRLVFAF